MHLADFTIEIQSLFEILSRTDLGSMRILKCYILRVRKCYHLP